MQGLNNEYLLQCSIWDVCSECGVRWKTPAQTRQSGSTIHPARAASWASERQVPGCYKHACECSCWDVTCLVLTCGRATHGSATMVRDTHGFSCRVLNCKQLPFCSIGLFQKKKKKKKTKKKPSNNYPEETWHTFSSPTCDPPCRLTPAAHRSCNHRPIAHLWLHERQSDQSQLFSKAPQMDCGMRATWSSRPLIAGALFHAGFDCCLSQQCSSLLRKLPGLFYNSIIFPLC